MELQTILQTLQPFESPYKWSDESIGNVTCCVDFNANPTTGYCTIRVLVKYEREGKYVGSVDTLDLTHIPFYTTLEQLELLLNKWNIIVDNIKLLLATGYNIWPTGTFGIVQLIKNGLPYIVKEIDITVPYTSNC